MLLTCRRLRAYLRRLTVRAVGFCVLCAGVDLAPHPSTAAGAEPGTVTSQPLAQRSGPRGPTLFRSLAPEETGIITQNNYDDPKMWTVLFREFLYGSIGTGVAICDYDHDGRPDVFITSKTESCRLFRNLGDWRFEDVTARAGVEETGGAEKIWKQGVTFVDVNNDSWPDIYLCRFNAPNLLYINQRDGTFRERGAAWGLNVTDASVMGCFADYDRDGWLDLFIVTNALSYEESIGRPDRLFHNNGNGTFTEVSSDAHLSTRRDQGHSALWWDFTGDNWPDLYVANDFQPPDYLYYNNGDGTFTDIINGLLPHTANSSMGGDLGDFNNDGRLDFLIADMEPSTHQKDYRSLANGRARDIPIPEEPILALQIPRNALLINSGLGRYLEAAQLAGVAATDWTWGMRFEDYDNDGRVDMFFTNGMVRELHNADMRSRINRAENIAQQIRILKESPLLPEANLAYRNLGDLKFEPVGPSWGLDQTGISFGSATGDLDGDGDLDIVFVNFRGPPTVLRNDSDQGHRATFALRGVYSNRYGIGATVRIDTKDGPQARPMMLARGYSSSSEPIAHFGLGEVDHIDRVTITWPSGRVQVVNDLDADRAYVVTEPETSTGSAAGRPDPNTLPFREIGQFAGLQLTAREEPFDETAIQPLVPRYFNDCGPAVAVGDLDGDGTDDVCFGGTTRDPPRILVADRKGYYRGSSSLAPYGNKSVNDGPILIFDADGDDNNDLLLTSGGVAAPANGAAYQPRLLLNLGGGLFLPADDGALPAFTEVVGAACAADFDRDGRLDVFLGGRVVPGKYPETAHNALWHNRAGTFEDVTENLAPGLRSVGLITSALWSDVDNDGWPDLLLALDWGPVRFFHNNQGAGFEDRTEAAGFADAGSGWWTSLASADFNSDGKPDYVAGNVGLNTPYRASPEEPALLFRGVFEQGTEPLSVEAYYENGKLWPRPARGELGAQLPSILRRYPSADIYSKATLEEILGADRMAAAQRFAATELRSGVFLSQPDGRFRFEALPRILQIAPLQGMAAGDFDGDGCADIVVVQNIYGEKQSIGRFDGGLGQLVRGDGKGNFEAVAPIETGLAEPGDACALAVIDFDGDAWPDFVVSRSNDPSSAWHNRGRTEGNPLAVRLWGRVGNRTATGARVTVELENGTTQTSEVVAGSGLMSQRTGTLFFGYPKDIPPRRVLVRWPSGRTSTEMVAAGKKYLIIQEP